MTINYNYSHWSDAEVLPLFAFHKTYGKTPVRIHTQSMYLTRELDYAKDILTNEKFVELSHTNFGKDKATTEVLTFRNNKGITSLSTFNIIFKYIETIVTIDKAIKGMTIDLKSQRIVIIYHGIVNINYFQWTKYNIFYSHDPL